METDEQYWASKREDERFKAHTPLRFAARIVLPDLSAARKVSVLDISRNGAKVHVGDGPDLPRGLYLMLPGPGGRDKIRLVCEKRWQVGNKIGVRFEEPLSDATLAGLAASADPERNRGASARADRIPAFYPNEFRAAIGE